MILVTGGAGFIGSHVVDALLAAGEEPVVLDHLSAGDGTNLPRDVEVVEADIADPGVIDRISTLRPRAVVHAAAQVSVAASMEDPALDLAVNVGGRRTYSPGRGPLARSASCSSPRAVVSTVRQTGRTRAHCPNPRATTAHTSTWPSATWSWTASPTPSPGWPTSTVPGSGRTSKVGSWRSSRSGYAKVCR